MLFLPGLPLETLTCRLATTRHYTTHSSIGVALALAAASTQNMRRQGLVFRNKSQPGDEDDCFELLRQPSFDPCPRRASLAEQRSAHAQSLAHYHGAGWAVTR